MPVNYAKILKDASNSIKDNKISNEEQYELMKLAIQHNNNEILETLLKAGFKANIDEYLEESGTTVTSLAEIAQAFNNTKALELIKTYMLSKPTKPVLSSSASDTTKKEVNNESYVTDTVPAATKTIKVEDNQDEENEEGIIGAAYHNQNGTLVIKKFDKPLSEKEYQKWLQENETVMMVNPTVRALEHLRKKYKNKIFNLP